MNEEKALLLYDAVTGVREEYIEEAAKPLPRRAVSYLPWAAGALAACFALTVGILLILMALGVGRVSIGPAAGGGGSGGDGATYQFYTGPIFPLTTLDAEETLTASRRTTLDFTPYRDAPVNPFQRWIDVTDEYLLTNTGSETRTYTLYCPIAMDLALEEDPRVTVDGALADPELIVGPFSDRSGMQPRLRSWEDYKKWLEDDYLRRTLEEPPSLDIPVTVYELKDRWGVRSEDAKAPTLSMEFTVDRSKTAVLSYNFNGWEYDPDSGLVRRLSSVPRPGTRGDGQSAYLLVLGEGIGSYELRAYTNKKCEAPMEDAGCTVVRYTSTLGEMVQLFRALDADTEEGYLTPEELEDYLASPRAGQLIARRWKEIGLLDGEYERFWREGLDWTVEDAFSHLRNPRVLYWRFTVTIPAGESREVRVASRKRASYDSAGPNSDFKRNGYDLTTLLGSLLRFSSQSAALEGSEQITILEQNFGFDPAQGILEVTLDPAQERYFLVVEAKEQE